MEIPSSPITDLPRRGAFFAGVFLLSCSVLLFQIVQTRILSVISWYYLAFFAISVAMLGMTIGAVWVYFNRARLTPETFSVVLSDTSLLAAITIPVSVMVQFCLVTMVVPTITTLFSWALLMASMTLPYVFAGIALSLALTRSPFPVGQVYGVDLLGSAFGCAAVVGVLNVLDGPTAILFAGAIAACASSAFALAATEPERILLKKRGWWRRPLPAVLILVALIPFNMLFPLGIKPIIVKETFERGFRTRFEKWNSYSRIVANPPVDTKPMLWGSSPLIDSTYSRQQVWMNIDGLAGTPIHHFDGENESIDFLKYDIVNLAYYVPGIRTCAVIGVGGGRDLMAAHLFGVEDITGIELNPIFIFLHTRHPFYMHFSNLTTIPGLKLHIDDARSWFASTNDTFDLIQMSMTDTWAATSAGAFSLSENGLYTLEGWRTFINRLSDNGLFTVSRWYSPGDINEAGRMVALAMASLIDRGVEAPRKHLFVAHAAHIATMVLSKAPFTQEKLRHLLDTTEGLGFKVLIAPDVEPKTEMFKHIMSATSIDELNKGSRKTVLDISIPTDNRPFFFYQLRFRSIPHFIKLVMHKKLPSDGVIAGNLLASIALLIILAISLAAVVCTIVIPLRTTLKTASHELIFNGTIYFTLIGAGFMFAEISMMQFFGLFLGHPIYAMGVCLFSLILSSGMGSCASGRMPLNRRSRIAVWGVMVGGYFIFTQWGLTHLFETATAQPLQIRILIALGVIIPVGFLMGFAFPTGMSLVEKIDAGPTPWFWGINGATGVLASVLAVMVSMAFGINVTMLLAGVCYLALIPTACALLNRSMSGAS
jgi:hypothetical protein